MLALRWNSARHGREPRRGACLSLDYLGDTALERAVVERAELHRPYDALAVDEERARQTAHAVGLGHAAALVEHGRQADLERLEEGRDLLGVLLQVDEQKRQAAVGVPLRHRLEGRQFVLD